MAGTVVELFLLRHAHAGDATRWHGDDARRPLSAKGRAQTDTLARHLVALGVDIDVIVSSPRLRAVETAEPIAQALAMDVVLDERVASGLTVRTLDDLLSDVGNPARVLIVGHDPDLSDVAAELLGTPSLPLRKGAIARLDAVRPLRAGSSILRWLIPPEALVNNANR